MEKSIILCESIDSLYVAQRQAVLGGNIPVGPFTGDEKLKASIQDLKTASKILHGSATKFTMVKIDGKCEIPSLLHN